jgi:non-heme chloroperoxidase
MRVVPIRAESARYAASLILIPDLWAGADTWGRLAGFLGHRGWEGAVLEQRGDPGGIAARADAVVQHAARLPSPPVLIGHGAGAVVALEAARRRAPAALVLAAPVSAGALSVRRLGWRLATLADLLRGGECRPPADADPRVAHLLAPDDRETVLDVIRCRGVASPGAGAPALVIAGDHDPLAPPADTDQLAAAIGAEQHRIREAGHWLVADEHWQTTANVLHRWLVRRLGEGLLELYAEAMAERDAEDE